MSHRAETPAPSSAAPAGTARRTVTAAAIVPSQTALGALDAMSELRGCANEARVLAWLCADRICGDCERDPWNDFDEHPGFEDGISGLAFRAVQRLEAALAEHERAWAPRCEHLRAHTAAVVPVALSYPEEDAILTEGGFALGEFKDGFNSAIEHCESFLSLAAAALAKRDIHVWVAVDAAVERLWQASREVMRTTDAVRVALVSVLQQPSEQRQAA